MSDSKATRPKSRRLQRSQTAPAAVNVLAEEEEEIELGEEGTTSTGETDSEDTDSSSDYEPEKETLSTDPQERAFEERVRTLIIQREAEREARRQIKKKRKYVE